MTDQQEPPPRQVAEDLENLDPGRARDRTRLAWRRTAVSFTAISAAVLKVAPIAGAPLLLMAVAVWSMESCCLKVGRPGVETKAQHRAIGMIALTTALTAVVSLVVALLIG